MTKTEEIMDIVADYASEVADIATSEAAFAHVWKSRYAYRDKTLAELKSAIEELVAERDALVKKYPKSAAETHPIVLTALGLLHTNKAAAEAHARALIALTEVKE